MILSRTHLLCGNCISETPHERYGDPAADVKDKCLVCGNTSSQQARVGVRRLAQPELFKARMRNRMPVN